MSKVWGYIEAIAAVTVLGSTLGIVFSLGESQGGGVYKLTERPPWLIYAVIVVCIVSVIGVFAHMSRRNLGESISVRLIQTVLMILFIGVILTITNSFR
ncbi:hypothetical protein [Guptibacillus algicola]|uniref:hypothetical protein n=1 Tax=Guptibacillus algicola TaxID=225844 RepID=UPI001CD61078|nr:hypothetical protein [Alkalihalobacillus algicola]MCA0989592.1 hypothetical protein [Alkalihalobacillus algicola]